MASPNRGAAPHAQGADTRSGHTPPPARFSPPPPRRSHPVTQPFTQPLPIPTDLPAAAAPPGRRRQSPWIHLALFFLTAGIGNVLYARRVSAWNHERER
ncbi:hypothetical protein [Nocardia aurea]|uniref:Uncharacterized protein n=1 Tax=Nocardia aurea TaxID=2144174 RepID=A0ABV3G537_9NOCA|nr:hypothetical protein [Nocardia aurea]